MIARGRQLFAVVAIQINQLLIVDNAKPDLLKPSASAQQTTAYFRCFIKIGHEMKLQAHNNKVDLMPVCNHG